MTFSANRSLEPAPRARYPQGPLVLEKIFAKDAARYRVMEVHRHQVAWQVKADVRVPWYLILEYNSTSSTRVQPTYW